MPGYQQKIDYMIHIGKELNFRCPKQAVNLNIGHIQNLL